MKTLNPTKRILTSFIAFIILFLICAAILMFLSSSVIRAERSVSSTEAITPTIILDAGHGGEDGGAIGANGVFEKSINLEIAKKMYQILTQQGIKCILTRDEDVLLYDRAQDYRGKKKILDMQARKKIAESYENAIFISIHQNSFPEKKYKGFQAYYSTNNNSSLELVRLIERNVKNTLQPNNRRTSKASGGSIYLLDNLYCPAILLECGFLSNEDECTLLCSEEYQNSLCKVICGAIEEFVQHY